VSIDPRFERSILAEFALGERRARRREALHSPRALAKRLHPGRRQVAALVLLAVSPPAQGSLLDHVRALSKAPGWPGYLARRVARAAIEDRLGGAPATGDTLTALRLLPDPELAG
jgi:hypothetical protein